MIKEIFIEGGAIGPNSRVLNTQCREGFSALLKESGLGGRMPRPVACGSRGNAYKDFKLALRKHGDAALLIDSEFPISDPDKPWDHLKKHERWSRPKNANDEQVFFMTTSMETWIVADQTTLKAHFGSKLNMKRLPSLVDMEARSPEDVHKALKAATKNCKAPYAKGAESFRILAKVDPAVLEQHLPSFARMKRILLQKFS